MRTFLETQLLTLTLLSYLMFSFASSLQGETMALDRRSLDTVDVLNALVKDYVIVAPIDPPVSQQLIIETISTSGPLTCDSMAIGNLVFTYDNGQIVSETLNNTVYQSLHTVIKATGLKLKCVINTVTRGTFGGTSRGTITVTSTTTSLTLPLNFFSSKFGYLLPVVATNPETNCKNILSLVLQYQFQVSGLTGAFLPAFQSLINEAVVAAVYAQACPMLFDLTRNLTSLVASNPLVELASTRILEPRSITELTSAAEAVLEADLSLKNLETFNPESVEDVINSMQKEFLDAPYVANVVEALLPLAKAVATIPVSNSEVASTLQAFISQVAGVEVNVTAEQVDAVINSQAFSILSNYVTQILSGSKTLSAVLDEVFKTYLSGIFDSFGGLPFLKDSRELQSGDGVGAIDFNELLSAFGDIIGDYSSMTVGELASILGESSSFSMFLVTYGNDTLLVDVISQWTELRSLFLNQNGEFAGFVFDVNTPLPTSVVDLLQRVSVVVPELKPILDLITSNGNRLEQVFVQYVSYELVLSPFGVFNISLDSMNLSSASNDLFLFEDFGFYPTSSIISPKLNLKDLLFEIGARVKLTTADQQQFIDVINLSGDFGLFSEMAATFAFNYELIQNFGFDRAVDLKSFGKVMVDYLTCVGSNIYAAVSAEKTESTLTTYISLETGAFDGFFKDFANALLYMYTPAVPAVVENMARSYTADILSNGVHRIIDNEASCLDNPILGPTSFPTPYPSQEAGGVLDPAEPDFPLMPVVAGAGGFFVVLISIMLYVKTVKSKQTASVKEDFSKKDVLDKIEVMKTDGERKKVDMFDV